MNWNIHSYKIHKTKLKKGKYIYNYKKQHSDKYLNYHSLNFNMKFFN